VEITDVEAITKRLLYIEDLRSAEAIFVGNSLNGLRSITLDDPERFISQSTTM
jgi:branched-subunit amino acid aminotransferase/4-amino-4-deoxychorismate lyase